MRNKSPGRILLAAGLLLTAAACNGQTSETGATTAGGGQGGGTAGSGQAGSGQAGSGQAGSGQAGSGNAGSGQAGGGNAGNGQAGGGNAGGGQAGGGLAGSGQAGSGNAGGVAGSPVTCDTYVGQASQAEINLSPFADEDAELLALEASGKIVAPQAMVERISSDLKAIRSLQPEVQQIHTVPPWGIDRIELSFDPGAKAALGDGSYTAWNCQNAWYSVEKKDIASAFDQTYVTLTFSHRYNTTLLAKDYASLPYVMSADPSHIVGESSTICVSFDQNLSSYIFVAGSGDCQAGCINHTYWGFTSDGTTITPLGTFSKPTPPPDWFKGLGDCTKWL
jgi:hypothetical protein